MRSASPNGVIIAMIALVCGATNQVDAGETLLFERFGDGVTERAVTVQEDWSPDLVEVLSRTFVGQKRGAKGLYRLTIGKGRNDIERSIGEFIKPSRYASIASEVYNRQPIFPTVAQVVGIGGSAVLQVRSGDRYYQTILAGNDPTRFKINNQPFHLLHFWLSGNRTPFFITTLFLQVSGPLSKTNSLAALKFLKQQTGMTNVVIVVRQDDWFVENEHFPALYPFSPNPRFPSEAEFRRGRSIACSESPRVRAACSEER